MYNAAISQAEKAFNQTEDPDEFQKILDRIKDTLETKIPTAVKGVLLVSAGAVATGMLSNIDALMKNTEKRVNKFGKDINRKITGKGRPFWRKRTTIDNFFCWCRGEQVKKGTMSVGEAIKTLFNAARGSKEAQGKIVKGTLTSNGFLAKTVRKIAGSAAVSAGKRADAKAGWGR